MVKKIFDSKDEDLTKSLVVNKQKKVEKFEEL